MEQRATRSSLWLAFLACVTLTGPVAGHIVFPALPDAARSLDVSYADIQWIVSLYWAALVFSSLCAGPMADRLGRRPVLLGGLGLFVAGSVIAATASDLPLLITGRIIQAVGSATTVTIPRALARDTLVGATAARAMALMAAALALAPAVAPLIGGFLTTHEGWRSTMAGMAILGVCISFWVWWSCGETLHTRSAASTAPLLHQYRRLFRDRCFVANCAIVAGTAGGFDALIAYAPKHCILSLGLAPDAFGMAMLLAAGGFFGGSMISMKAVKTMDYRSLILLGARVCAAAIAGLALLSDWASPIGLLVPLFAFALGTGLAFPNAMYGALQVEGRLAASASALVGASRFALAMVATPLIGLFVDSALEAAGIVLLCMGLVGWGIKRAGAGRAAFAEAPVSR